MFSYLSFFLAPSYFARCNLISDPTIILKVPIGELPSQQWYLEKGSELEGDVHELIETL